jgi:hypothetical protein
MAVLDNIKEYRKQRQEVKQALSEDNHDFW